MAPADPLLCPTCGMVNPSGSRFCGSCGGPLVVQRDAATPACRRCGSPNLRFFGNGKGICVFCKHIFAWGRTPDGGLAILEPL